jgi:hypothetical protein
MPLQTLKGQQQTLLSHGLIKGIYLKLKMDAKLLHRNQLIET